MGVLKLLLIAYDRFSLRYLFSILVRLFLVFLLFAFAVYRCLHGGRTDLALTSIRLSHYTSRLVTTFNIALTSIRLSHYTSSVLLARF